MFRKLAPAYSSRILEIYKMGLDTGNTAFETELDFWTDLGSETSQTLKLDLPG
jgi:hypothetical protein